MNKKWKIQAFISFYFVWPFGWSISRVGRGVGGELETLPLVLLKAISYPTIKFVAGNHKFIETSTNFHYIEDKSARVVARL